MMDQSRWSINLAIQGFYPAAPTQRVSRVLQLQCALFQIDIFRLAQLSHMLTGSQLL